MLINNWLQLIKYFSLSVHVLQPVPAPGSKGQRPKAFNVFFRVKFYVENINDLKFAQTRHLYYLQLRKDLLGEEGIG